MEEVAAFELAGAVELEEPVGDVPFPDVPFPDVPEGDTAAG